MLKDIWRGLTRDGGTLWVYWNYEADGTPIDIVVHYRIKPLEFGNMDMQEAAGATGKPVQVTDF